MSAKQIKSWGTIGGLKSTSLSYTVPTNIVESQWKTEDDYTEVTHTMADGSNPAEGLEPELSPDLKTMVWYEVSQSWSGGPAGTCTIKKHVAHKIEYPNNGEAY